MNLQRRIAAGGLASAVAFVLLAAASRGEGDIPPAAAAIRAEATRSSSDPEGRPLPLACHWNAGLHANSAGWSPARQMEWIAAGHHILPFFAHPRIEAQLDERQLEAFRTYYEQPIRQARAWRLPLSLKATQWESLLSIPPFSDLPAEKNPNVVSVEGKIVKRVSPFGPTPPWREAGRLWTDNPAMQMLQQWYPDPPLVLFLSNNEHAKLRWHQVEESQRYLDRYGLGRDDDFKRKVVGDGWIERYRALHEGMRAGLGAPAWKEAAMFVGYNACGPPHFARWGGWTAYSLHCRGRIAPYPLMWDGGSHSYYTHDWDPSTDYTVWSPQIESMNLAFMQREALELNPRFWFEMSVWDGAGGGKDRTPVPEMYRRKGQVYDPVRYGGFVQFGMWLLRPRAVREFRGWAESSDAGMPYFMAIVEAVDRVHNDPVLRRFWRRGQLVPNSLGQHPYQTAVPEEYRDEDRWFLLDADCNPQQFPWKLDEEVAVFALALVLGDSPQREWLVAAHSPLKDRAGVTLTVPGYGPLAVDVARGGSFYLLREGDDRAQAVGRK